MFFLAERYLPLMKQRYGKPAIEFIERGGGRLFLLKDINDNFVTGIVDGHGLSVPIWNQYDVADQYLRDMNLKFRIIVMDNRRVLELTKSMAIDGFSAVAIDSQKGKENMVSINLFNNELERFVSIFDCWLADLDLEIQTLDRLIASGCDYEDKWNYISIDCSNCGMEFGVHHSIYRGWRNRKAIVIPCKYCSHFVEPGHWSRIECHICNYDFAYLPNSIYTRLMDRKLKWVCYACDPSSLLPIFK